MTITDWIQAISMLILVVVTGIYAWRTHIMSKATKQQADASVRMAEAIARPALFPEFPKPGVVRFTNRGSGDAFDVEFKFAYSSPEVVRQAWSECTGQYGSLLSLGPKYAVVQVGGGLTLRPELAQCSPGNIGTAFAEYSDVYSRRFLSGCGYRCEKQDGDRVVLVHTETIYPIMKRGDNSK